MNMRCALVLLCFLPASIRSFAGSHPGAVREGGGGFAVIGYSIGRGGGMDDSTAGKLTHVIYSFLHLKGGMLALNGPRDSAAIASLVALRERHPNLRVLVSLGGWGGCADCSGVFATPRGRKDFVRSALRVLSETRTDGLDIDWEYPAFEGYPGHAYAPEDRHNFTLLVRELRETLGTKYELSFASGGFAACIRASIEWADVMPLVDRVNVMTYDFVNGNSTVTGHQTALYSGPGQVESTDNAVRLLDSLGVPPEKIVIGAAFYARVWGGVPDTNNGLFQPGRFVRYVPYRDLGAYFRQNSGFTPLWDSTSGAPFSYSAENGLFATYDDPRSAASKTSYALRKHLGGIMFWELGGDTPSHELLNAIESTRRPP